VVHVDGEVVNADNIGLCIVSDLARNVNQEQRSGSTAPPPRITIGDDILAKR
jgi:hypothetical protein